MKNNLNSSTNYIPTKLDLLILNHVNKVKFLLKDNWIRLEFSSLPSLERAYGPLKTICEMGWIDTYDEIQKMLLLKLPEFIPMEEVVAAVTEQLEQAQFKIIMCNLNEPKVKLFPLEHYANTHTHRSSNNSKENYTHKTSNSQSQKKSNNIQNFFKMLFE